MLTAFLAIAATQLLLVALLFGTLYLDREPAPSPAARDHAPPVRGEPAPREAPEAELLAA